MNNLVRTALYLNPWGSSAVSLHNAIHEKLFTSDEGIALLSELFQRLSSALHVVEFAFLTSPLEHQSKHGHLRYLAGGRTSIRSSTRLVQPLSATGFTLRLTTPCPSLSPSL